MDSDDRFRALLEEHWRASEAGELVREHALYPADAVLDYPQSGERFLGRDTIAAQRGSHPAERHFEVLDIRGGAALWISECVITYNAAPVYSVSIMEFTAGLVVHETQYVADPFDAPASRAGLAVRIPSRHRAQPLWPRGWSGTKV